jgi:tRNA(fMet)-specific endonuclease VapC
VAEPRYLLDTNILIYTIGDAPPLLIERLQVHEEQLCTSALCVAEALAGERPAAEVRAILDLLRIVQPLPFDVMAARSFADVPFRRRRIDRFIAAQAVSRTLIVVTNNEADFQDVPGLVVENWTEA